MSTGFVMLVKNNDDKIGRALFLTLLYLFGISHL